MSDLNDFCQTFAADGTWNSSPDGSPNLSRRLHGGSERPSTSKAAAADSPDEFKRGIDDMEPEDMQTDAPQSQEAPKSKWIAYKYYAKLIILMCFWLAAVIMLMIAPMPIDISGMLTVPINEPAFFDVEGIPTKQMLGVDLHGPFEMEDTDVLYTFKQGDNDNTLTIQVKNVLLDKQKAVKETKDLSGEWKLSIVRSSNFDTAKMVKRGRVFFLYDEPKNTDGWVFRVYLTSSLTTEGLPLLVTCYLSPVTTLAGFVFGLLTLLLFLILIGFDILHRTFAVMFITTLAVGIISVMNLRPTLPMLVEWMETEVLLLLFGMMVLIALCMETGIFDYLAVLSFQVFNGHIWPSINIIIAVSAICSTLIDKAALVLILGPLCLRICEVMNVHPVPSIITLILFMNIGSTTVPFSDPKHYNVISNPYFMENDITTGKYIAHMLPGVLLVSVQTYFQLRMSFRNIRKIQFRFSPEATRLRRIIIAWKRAAMGISNYSKDEQTVRTALVSKIKRMRLKLNTLAKVDKPVEDFSDTLAKLKATYHIRNKVLLIKSGVAFAFVIALFLLDQLPHMQYLSRGWIALMGAILILVLADKEEMETILGHVQWVSLVFIATFDALSEIFYRLGLFEYIGELLEHTIVQANPSSRLLVAILCILWISAILSCVLDTKMVAAMMVHVSISVAAKKDVPWHPLVYAMAFGCGLGANGTIIASTANIVGVGIAEQQGYSFYFWYFLRIGIPIMLGNLMVITVYLVFAHVIGAWDLY